MKVLVVGASGTTGGSVLPRLVRRGVVVRALLRPGADPETVRARGAAETATADLNDLDALTSAADGVDGVFGVIPAFADDEAGIGRNLVAAARRAAVRKFVFSSVYHPALPLSNHHGKLPAEAALYDSDLDFTILQPAIFMQQLTALWDTATRSGRIGQPYSADAKMAYVHYDDVAEVAAAAFLGDRLSHGTFELAAPGMYSRRDVARLMGESLGRPVSVETPTFADWAESARLPDELREGLDDMDTHYDQHGFRGGNDLVLATLLGRTPLTVEAFIRRLAAAR